MVQTTNESVGSVERARAVLVKLFREGTWDRADLEEALEEAGMRPFGTGSRRRVTISFMIGAESGDDLADATVQGFANEAAEALAAGWSDTCRDDDVVFLNPEDGWDVTLGPIIED